MTLLEKILRYRTTGPQREDYTPINMARASICLDFDGVFNTYSGWRGEDELFEPRPGLAEFLREIRRRGFGIVVCSTRPAEKIIAWLERYNIQDVDSVVDRKPPAVAYLDDRGIQFNGDYAEALKALASFRVYWEH